MTKLSLLLKCLEGETEASIAHQMSLWNERILPTLDDNIKSGNSLIDTDYYDSQLDFGEDRKIKPFNWEKGFLEVFNRKARGFDVVIGNPPYLRMQGMQESQPFALEYYKQHYKAASAGNYDLYVLFDEKGYTLLNENGLMGFIQPHKFFQADFGEGIRNLLAKDKAIKEIVHFGSEQVFEAATTYTCLLFLSKKATKDISFIKVDDLELFSKSKSSFKPIKSKQPQEGEKWNFVNKAEEALMIRLKSQIQTLGDITKKIFVGLQTSADKIYVLKYIKEKNKSFVLYSKSLDQEVEIEKGLIKPFLMGKDVKRYSPMHAEQYVIFPYDISSGKAVLMSKEFIKEKFPYGWDYLLKNKKELERRENGKMNIDAFYAYIYPKNLTEFKYLKISTPEIAVKPQMTFDENGEYYHTTKVYSFLFNSNHKENQKYFLGLLNSKILWFFLKSTGYVLKGGFFTFKTEYLKPFPIKLIDFNNGYEVESYNHIITLVDQLLSLHKEKSNTKLQSQIDQIQTKIEYCEGKVDELVYGLYGLTAEERKVVEGG